MTFLTTDYTEFHRVPQRIKLCVKSVYLCVICGELKLLPIYLDLAIEIINDENLLNGHLFCFP